MDDAFEVVGSRVPRNLASVPAQLSVGFLLKKRAGSTKPPHVEGGMGRLKLLLIVSKEIASEINAFIAAKQKSPIWIIATVVLIAAAGISIHFFEVAPGLIEKQKEASSRIALHKLDKAQISTLVGTAADNWVKSIPKALSYIRDCTRSGQPPTGKEAAGGKELIETARLDTSVLRGKINGTVFRHPVLAEFVRGLDEDVKELGVTLANFSEFHAAVPSNDPEALGEWQRQYHSLYFRSNEAAESLSSRLGTLQSRIEILNIDIDNDDSMMKALRSTLNLRVAVTLFAIGYSLLYFTVLSLHTMWFLHTSKKKPLQPATIHAIQAAHGTATCEEGGPGPAVTTADMAPAPLRGNASEKANR